MEKGGWRPRHGQRGVDGGSSSRGSDASMVSNWIWEEERRDKGKMKAEGEEEG